MNEKPESILRFTILRRIEHFVLILSFTTLALTGLPQKFSTANISINIIQLLGGIEMVRIIHRFSATIFLLEAIYHLVDAGYRLYVKREEPGMLPTFKDVTDAIQAFLFNLGLAKHKPRMLRYNFIEKAEYWAMIWGLVMMALTGFVMWNPIATTSALPGQVIPAAKAAHGAEAVLAVLAILVWHFYNVHLKRLNLSMLHGRLPLEEMEDEHVLELENILKNEPKPLIPPAVLKKRKTVYFPVATLISLGLILGVFRFITFEQTAITTVPEPAGLSAIYVPQTPTPTQTQSPTAVPTATPTTTSTPVVSLTVEDVTGLKETVTAPPAVAAVTWDQNIAAIVQASCSSCHGGTAGLDVSSYATLMKGSSSGPVIKPGDPSNSLLLTKVQDGKHMANFTPDQLDLIFRWIKAGAPQN